MTTVTIAMLLFGLGVFSVGYWASRKLDARASSRPTQK
jgi:hypothetical protein